MRTRRTRSTPTTRPVTLRPEPSGRTLEPPSGGTTQRAAEAEGPRRIPTNAAVTAVGIAVVLVAVAVILALPSSSSKQKSLPPRNPYLGLGTWVDMYSWSDTFTGGAPTFGLTDVDAMAAAGVQTLYIQAASQTGPAAVLEPAHLRSLIDRAHHLGLSVVVWYQPTLVSGSDDLTRLIAISRLPVDGVAVDIESTDVADIAQRNASLVTLSQQLRRAVPNRPLGAIVLPAVLLEVVNPSYWPAFPYLALVPFYDAWLPMVYWTDRLASSGYRDGYTYTSGSVTRLRADLGPVGRTTTISPIGGVSADGLRLSDLTGFVTAVKQTAGATATAPSTGGAVSATAGAGGSLYEWPGTTAADWNALRPLRD